MTQPLCGMLEAELNVEAQHIEAQGDQFREDFTAEFFDEDELFVDELKFGRR